MLLEILLEKLNTSIEHIAVKLNDSRIFARKKMNSSVPEICRESYDCWKYFI